MVRGRAGSAHTQEMSTPSCCRPPRVEYREQEAPIYDDQARTLALPFGSTAAAAIIVHEEAHEAEAFDAAAEVTFLVQIDAETTMPVCTSAFKVCGHCGTVVATATVSTHMERCSLSAWHHVIAAHVAVQAARAVLSGHRPSGGLGLRLNEPEIRRELGAPQRPCSPPAPTPTEPMSPLALPPLMSAVTLPSYNPCQDKPIVFAFAVDGCLGHEDSRSAEDGQADEDSSSSSSTDDSIATEENAAAASMLTGATVDEGQDCDDRPTKKQKKRSRGLWKYETALESPRGQLWRKQSRVF